MNNIFRDKIATGSFDKTCKLWSSETGKCYHTYRGHSAEIVRYISKSNNEYQRINMQMR